MVSKYFLMSKSGLLPIEKTVQEELKKNFSGGDDLRFILGVSGGIDSISLLHIFNRLEVETVAVHINYGARGEASDKDEAFVKQVCDELDVEFVLHKVNAEEADFSNFQGWAREVRYKRFEEEARKIDADGIAVAHNKDDQIETILQKIFRGSGLAGWSGMKVWNGKLFRPLLNVSRDEIEKYCKEKDITYRLDQSNLKSKYARNFLRNECLPQLEERFPGWRKNVLRVSEQADVFESALEYILADIQTGNKGLKRKSFLDLPLSLQKSLLLHFLKKYIPDISLSTDALSQFDKLNTLQTGKKLQLSDELFLMRDRSSFKLIFKDSDLPTPVVIRREQLENKSVIYKNIRFKLQKFNQPDLKNELYLDAIKLKWPLQVRPWKEGDKIQQLGMRGHQSVADHLTNRKVNAAKKHKALVVETIEEKIAAVIFPSAKSNGAPGTIAEKFKCSNSTKQTLVVEMVS